MKTMGYRRLGKTGLRVSTLSLGGWTTFGGSIADASVTRDILHAAYDAGIRSFDTADSYERGESERAMGKVLAEFPRTSLVLASKVFFPVGDEPNDRGLSRKHVFESVHGSLRRLGTDYLDIYYCHRFDPETPLEETVAAMSDLVRQGKILYWGTSEWTAPQIRDAHAIADARGLVRPSVEQPQLSLLERTKFDLDIEPVAEATGMGLVTWSPLASGVLTGKYDAGIPTGSRLENHAWLRDLVLDDRRLGLVKKFGRLARDLGRSRAQLAIAWAVSRRSVSSVILGATSLAQLDENLGALDVELDDDVLARLDELFAPGVASVVGYRLKEVSREVRKKLRGTGKPPT
ncbi:MAG: aldo/keto reductase family protein [Polyangiaceae bacterium]